MIRACYCFITFIIFFGSINAQVPLPPLSQNTNEYIYQSSAKLTYISSIDGLNIFDGDNINVYNASSHNMYGNNIQSDFYEDEEGLVWFCTYGAIHVHNYRIDSIAYYFGKNKEGEEISSDYRIIDLQDSILWFIADKYIFQFNIYSRKIIKTYPALVSGVREISFREDENKYQFFCASLEGFYVYSINKETEEIEDSFKEGNSCQTFWRKNDSIFYLGDLLGNLYVYNINSRTVERSVDISKKEIRNVDYYYGDNLMISGYTDNYIYNFIEDSIVTELTYSINGDTLDRISSFYISDDFTEWMCNDGTGVYYVNDSKKKFDTWPARLTDKYSITGIYPNSSNSDLLLTTRNNGIVVVDDIGNVVQQNSGEDTSSEFFTILSGAFISNDGFFFIYRNDYYLYSLSMNTYNKLSTDGSYRIPYGVDLQKVTNDKLLTHHYGSKLYWVTLIENIVHVDTAYVSDSENDYLTSIKTLDNEYFYVSQNEERIIVLYNSNGSLDKIATIDIPGGVKSICESSSPDSIYLSNSNGLYLMNKYDYSFDKIKSSNETLSQNIYAIQRDNSDNYWLSTNNGLYYWNSSNDSTHQFGLSDGVQSLEYNTNAYYKDNSGRMYFGGINGLNAFYPDDIELMSHEAPVMISEYMIDDIVSTEFGTAYSVDEITLPYNRNTISFRFHALDYSDMTSTRVKYKMKGIDDNYVVTPTSNNGFTRYPNLPAGKYTFSIIGANADQVWNTSSRNITITILPPYWQTWWFRSLILFASIGIVSLIFRSYYKTQLRKKDYLLKEQTLIIEKQAALQNERNRIAAEMHDDLGGGLTTIKYLSQRAVKNIEHDKSRGQVEKIMNQSQELVNNMSEIIWAMNSGFDTLENLVAYIRRYTHEYLDTYNINVEFRSEIIQLDSPMTGDVRRNIFLVIKEIIHNTVKHAEATIVYVEMTSANDSLLIIIGDNGMGLVDEKTLTGNGLKNIERRIDSVGGTVERRYIDGLQYNITIPLTTIS